MASVSPTRSSSRVLAGRVLAGRMFAALRQGVRRQAQVAAETVEADLVEGLSTQICSEMDLLEAMPERRAQLKNRGAKEDEELERLKAEIAEQMELLQEMYEEAHVRKCKELERLKAEIAEQMELLQEEMHEEATGRDELMPEPAELQSNDSNAVKALLTSCDDSRRQRAEGDKLEEPLQHFGAPASSSDLHLRKDTLEAQVKSSRTELLKKKFERQFLEEKLNALECQFPDSTAEKEEIRSLLGDLAAQTVESTNAEEQVQKALKDIQELRAENDALEALQQLTENEAIGRDELMPLVELQQSNDAVKALLKKYCEDLQRQRAERKKLEAKLRAVERQLSDVTKQDEMKTLLRNFAVFTAANSKAEAAIQAVLNE